MNEFSRENFLLKYSFWDASMCKSKWKVFIFSAIWLLSAGCGSGPPSESVSGTIRMDPKIRSQAREAQKMLVILLPEKGGPPIAVQRLVRAEFPYKFVLTKDDLRDSRRPFSGNVRVQVRLVRDSVRVGADGEFGPLLRGEFSGENKNVVPIGSKDVDVVIDQVGSAEHVKVAKATKGKLPTNHPPMLPGSPSQTTPPTTGKLPPNHPPMSTSDSGRQTPSAPGASGAGNNALTAGAGGGETISGTIEVASGLAAKATGKPVLFIIARSDRPGPPLAVSRIGNPKFPLKFTLSKANVMMQGMPFQGNVRITVRLDNDGSAGPPRPGDLEGKSSGLVPVGAKDVIIILNKEY